MNYAESFKFVFRQPAWPKKMLILVGLTLVPIVGWIMIAGYLLAITRNVIRGEQQLLPEWTDFGRMFADGLKLIVVAIVWSMVPTIFDLLTDVLDLPLLGLVDLIVQLIFSVLIISASGALASSGNLADGFAVPAIIARVRATPRPYVTAAIASTIIAVVAVVVIIIPAVIIGFVLSLILPIGLGIVITIAAGLLLYGLIDVSAAHLTGQAHRAASGSSLPPAPRF